MDNDRIAGAAQKLGGGDAVVVHGLSFSVDSAKTSGREAGAAAQVRGGKVPEPRVSVAMRPSAPTYRDAA